ncbi:hypothetical protein TNCV_4197091 [Trichonephila clavipes]|nr:hypothetical protein TNCV_4197091 [Trichonephila clavipes]
MRIQLVSLYAPTSPRLIEVETFDDSDMNYFIDCENGQEEPDSLRVDKNFRDPAFQQIGKAFSSNKYQLRKEN